METIVNTLVQEFSDMDLVDPIIYTLYYRVAELTAPDHTLFLPVLQAVIEALGDDFAYFVQVDAPDASTPEEITALLLALSDYPTKR